MMHIHYGNIVFAVIGAFLMSYCFIKFFEEKYKLRLQESVILYFIIYFIFLVIYYCLLIYF